MLTEKICSRDNEILRIRKIEMFGFPHSTSVNGSETQNETIIDANIHQSRTTYRTTNTNTSLDENLSKKLNHQIDILNGEVANLEKVFINILIIFDIDYILLSLIFFN